MIHRYEEGMELRPGLNWRWDGRWFDLRFFLRIGDRCFKAGFDIRLGTPSYANQGRFLYKAMTWRESEMRRLYRGEA